VIHFSFFPGPGGFSLPVLSLDPVSSAPSFGAVLPLMCRCTGTSSVSSMPKECRLILDFARASLQLGLKVRVAAAGSPFNFLLLVCDTYVCASLFVSLPFPVRFFFSDRGHRIQF
jgi:hypothetical protein